MVSDGRLMVAPDGDRTKPIYPCQENNMVVRFRKSIQPNLLYGNAYLLYVIPYRMSSIIGALEMVIETIRNLVSDKEPTPNKFTIAMGELIRKAREEADLSQSDLARKIYRRQATLSDIENGKVEVSSGTLALLAAVLDKPITYFYPPFLYQELKPEKFTPLERELLIKFSNISSDHLREVAIDLVRVLSQFDPTDMIIDRLDTVIELDKRDEEIERLLERRRKRNQNK